MIYEYLLEAAVDAGLDVVAAERQTLTELSWHLNALLQQQTEPRLVDSSRVVGDQTEQTCTHACTFVTNKITSNQHKKPSYRWGTARRGRASWNLV